MKCILNFFKSEIAMRPASMQRIIPQKLNPEFLTIPGKEYIVRVTHINFLKAQMLIDL